MTRIFGSDLKSPKQSLLAVAVIAVLVGVFLLLAACGDTSSSNGASGNGGSNTSNNNSDPTANYSPDQVMSTFVKCYQAGDWSTCDNLVASEVKAGWSSPDELQLNAEANDNDKGKIHIIGFNLASDQGSQKFYMISYYRSKDAEATVPPENQQDNAQFVVKRINNSWKIDEFYYI